MFPLLVGYLTNYVCVFPLLVRYLAKYMGQLTLQELLDRLDTDISTNGLDVLSPGAHIGNFARPRRFEIASAMNRLRTAVVTQRQGGGEAGGHVRGADGAF